MTAKLTIYGGVDEIGGNKILLQTENGSVLLDFGRRMGAYSKYFSEFIQARSKNALRDLIKLGILPKLDGIYAPSLLDMTLLFENASVKEKVPLQQALDYWKTTDVSPFNPEDPAVDGVFISHAHFDHIQDLSFLDPCIPVYCTEKTRVLAKSMTDVSVSGIDDQYYKLSKQVTIKQKEQNYKTLCPGECSCSDQKEEELPIIEDSKTKFKFTYEIAPRYRRFNTATEGQIRGIKYSLIPVGHSVPGACSVLLTLPDGKRILYTGDLRFHGTGEVSIDDYIQAIGDPVDVLIIEGTRIKSDDVLTEDEVAGEIKNDVKQAQGLVLINFGWKDLTRFNTIYCAVKENKRVFVISPKLAYLLYEMHCNFPDEFADPRTMPNLKVYLKREGDLLYSKVDYDKYKMGYLHYHGRNSAQDDRNIVRVAERLDKGGKPDNPKNPLPPTSEQEPYDYQEIYSLAMHHLDNGVRAYQIRSNPLNYVLMFSYWDANELFDLFPINNDSTKTRYISASTEPFNEEMEIDETKMINWLDFFGIEYDFELKNDQKFFTRRHVSGHACKLELEEIIQKMKPKTIIPIHTENAHLFKEIFEGKIILPQYAKSIEI